MDEGFRNMNVNLSQVKKIVNQIRIHGDSISDEKLFKKFRLAFLQSIMP